MFRRTTTSDWFMRSHMSSPPSANEGGLDNVAFSYQWQADDSNISGATGETYTLADADEGKAIGVTVSFTDDAGNAETLTSAATDAVDGAPSTPLTVSVGERCGVP